MDSQKITAWHSGILNNVLNVTVKSVEMKQRELPHKISYRRPLMKGCCAVPHVSKRYPLTTSADLRQVKRDSITNAKAAKKPTDPERNTHARHFVCAHSVTRKGAATYSSGINEAPMDCRENVSHVETDKAPLHSFRRINIAQNARTSFHRVRFAKIAQCYLDWPYTVKNVRYTSRPHLRQKRQRITVISQGNVAMEEVLPQGNGRPYARIMAAYACDAERKNESPPIMLSRYFMAAQTTLATFNRFVFHVMIGKAQRTLISVPMEECLHLSCKGGAG